jgi:molybdate transport system regulatory protein
MSDVEPCLDSIQLNAMEQSFREWAKDSARADVRLSRRRILIVFLLIRYTGAKLNEVLSLNPFADIDILNKTVYFRTNPTDSATVQREVGISENLCQEIQFSLSDPEFKDSLDNNFKVDPGFVRRKFYERAQACGFPKNLSSPEMIRRSRAVELMQSSMPLPAVQMMLGHSTPNLTSSYVSFSEDEVRRITRIYVERESSRKTSARNSFFGKIQVIQKGDIQSKIDMVTIDGHVVTTMITNDSLIRLGLKQGSLASAEVKAPWVILHAGDNEPVCSAENRFKGIISQINIGEVNTEYSVRISDSTELCAIVSTNGSRKLGLTKGNSVWALFNCYSVVLHAD